MSPWRQENNKSWCLNVEMGRPRREVMVCHLVWRNSGRVNQEDMIVCLRVVTER